MFVAAEGGKNHKTKPLCVPLEMDGDPVSSEVREPKSVL